MTAIQGLAARSASKGISKDSDVTPENQEYQVLERAQVWYEPDVVSGARLSTLVVQLVSTSPNRINAALELLARALAEGVQDGNGEVMQVGKERFADRAAMKARCQQLLRLHRDDEQLNPEDTDFMLKVLQHHPRGKEKARGCRAIAAGVHPTFQMRCFYVVRDDGREDFSYIRCVDNAPTFEVKCQANVCEACVRVLQVHPAAMQRFASLIEDRFPHIRGPRSTVERHRNWAQALLTLCTRLPQLTEYLLILLIRRMVQIDSDLSKLDSSLPDAEEALGAGVQEDAKVVAQVELMAQVLDCNMMMCFEFLQRSLTHKGKTKEQDDSKLVLTMLGIFENAVMHTHKVKCVQFLWFYLASLKPAWAEAYLSLLLQVVYASGQAPGRRLLSLSYLSSFLARAGFLPTKYALRTSQYLTACCLESLQVAENGHDHGQKTPGQLKVIVALVQALCYILCWCAEGFAQEEVKPGVSALDVLLPPRGDHGESFTAVLENANWPITRIRRMVANQFCRTIRRHRPTLAASLQHQLRKIAAPLDSQVGDDDEPVDAGRETFFPFDPYRLRHSNMFLMGIYRDWSRATDEDEFQDSGDEEENGFVQQSEVANSRMRASSVLSSSETFDEEGLSDADFTDEADVASRGFGPSVGPSPAFRPRSSTDMGDMCDVSPMIMPMSMISDYDEFALPQASIDTDSGSSFLSHMLQNPAYRT